MKIRKLSSLFVLLVLIHLPGAHADSPVWKVVKGEHHLFIGGTIHILSKSDYPLPSNFEKAYSQSAIIVFETDIQKLQTPEFQQKLLNKVVYTDGRNLKTLLSKATFEELALHLSNRGIPIAQFLNFKVGMLASTLTIIELQRLGLLGAGVDEFFNMRAINDQKVLGQLETVDEQLMFISTMGDGREDEMVSYTLRDLKKLPEMMQSIKDAWRHGDNQKLNRIALTPVKSEFPDVYDQIILGRNNAWMPKIEAMLKTRDVEFVLVGVLHLVGDDGILRKLASRGYDIQKP